MEKERETTNIHSWTNAKNMGIWIICSPLLKWIASISRASCRVNSWLTLLRGTSGTLIYVSSFARFPRMCYVRSVFIFLVHLIYCKSWPGLRRNCSICLPLAADINASWNAVLFICKVSSGQKCPKMQLCCFLVNNKMKTWKTQLKKLSESAKMGRLC